MHRKKCLIAAAAIVILIAAALFLFLPRKGYLTLRDKEGKLYARYLMEEGERFSVSFVHSVNRRPLYDIYEIHDGKIFVEECKYAAFGAGVQTELNPGETMSYTDDGYILITGIHQDRSNMRYTIAGISDHMLEFGEISVNLRELCGRNAAVFFNYEYMLF